MIRTLVMIAVGAFVIGDLNVAVSQRPRSSGNFRIEQIEDATRRLERFINRAKSVSGLPFEFSEQQKSDLVKKYLGEADRSPYFWLHLEETFRQKKARMPSGDAPPPAQKIAAYVVEESYVSVMLGRWGSLALSSEPSGADVFLKLSSGRINEGRTKINRRYPEGYYIFVVELSGHKSREISVKIDKDQAVEEKVVLEKQ